MTDLASSKWAQVWNTLEQHESWFVWNFAVAKGADDKASTGKKSELDDDPSLEHPWTGKAVRKQKKDVQKQCYNLKYLP